MNDELYREHILEHYRNPHHRGVPKSYDTSARERNVLCGDDITMYVSFNASSTHECSFEGEGCALSIASASLLCGAVRDRSMKDIEEMDMTDMRALLCVDVHPAREKCVMTPLVALQKAVTQFHES